MEPVFKKVLWGLLGLFLFFQSNAQTDSLVQVFEQNIEDESDETFYSGKYLLDRLFERGDSDLGMSYSKRLIEVTKSQYSGRRGDSLLAIAYDDASRAHSSFVASIPQAIAFMDSAIVFYKKIEFVGRQANAHGNKASFLNSLNRPVEAIKELNKAQKLVLENDLEFKEIVLHGIYRQISLSHKALGQFEQALEYALKSMNELKSYDTSDLSADMMYRLGIGHQLMATVYYDLESWNESKEQALKSLSYMEKLSNDYGMIDPLNSLGNVEMKNENYEEAETYYTKVVEISKRLNNDYGYALALVNRGGMYSDAGSYRKGLNDLLAAFPICERMGNLEFLKVVNYNISEAYEKLGESRSALKYYKEYKVMEDSMKNQSAQAQLNELNVKYETLEKESQLAQQGLTLKTQEATIATQNSRMTIIGGAALVVILIGIIYYNRSRAQQRATFQATLLSEKERGLVAIVEATESERKRISKDLHDGIGQQLSALKLGLQSVKSNVSGQVQEEIEELTDQFSKSADEVRQISHQMMPRSLMEKGLVEAMDGLLENSFRYADIDYTFEHHGMDGRFDEKVEVSLYRILQELVNNVIKHSEATSLSVQLIKSKARLMLLVEDNGKGLDSDNAEGHGLLNIKNRLDMINGEVNFEPSPESGVLATVVVPV